MKYLKTYEENDNLKYDDVSDCYMWKVYRENRRIALRKIMDEKNAKTFQSIMGAHEYYYIFKTKKFDGSYEWSYSGPGYKRLDYRKPEIYMGEVEVTEDDVKKYNEEKKLKKDIKKYNL